jgi:hypothetical protein
MLRAQIPHHVNAVMQKAQSLHCRMRELGDCNLRPRLSRLQRRALVAMLHQCHALIRRSAELVDAINVRHISQTVLSQVLDCADAATPYLLPGFKHLYDREIRQTLVQSLQNSATASFTDAAAQSAKRSLDAAHEESACFPSAPSLTPRSSASASYTMQLPGFNDPQCSCKRRKADNSCPIKENHVPSC